MKATKKVQPTFEDFAPLETTQLLTPRTLGHLDVDERQEYLRRLFQMDVRLITFVMAARSLGFGVTCHWNLEASMPQLVWLH
jgi:hypothetical protein